VARLEMPLPGSSGALASASDGPAPFGLLPMRLLRLAEQANLRMAQACLTRHGLGRTEWLVLAALAVDGRQTASAIGASWSLHKTKVSRAVRALEQRRWLKRMDDAADHRFEHLELTSAGHGAYREVAVQTRHWEQGLTQLLGVVNHAHLRRGLDDLEDALTRLQP